MGETRALQSELVVRQGKEPVRLGKSVASVSEVGPEVHSSSKNWRLGEKRQEMEDKPEVHPSCPVSNRVMQTTCRTPWSLPQGTAHTPSHFGNAGGGGGGAGKTVGQPGDSSHEPQQRLLGQEPYEPQ